MKSFDPRDVIKAQRIVSVRDLVRGSGRLIDEVELNNSIFVLSRHGRMAALVTPIPERTVVEITGQPWPDQQQDELPTEVPDLWRELKETQRDVLERGLASYPDVLSTSGISGYVRDFMVALGFLESRGLVERTSVGRRLTADGYAAARWLQAQVDSPADAPS